MVLTEQKRWTFLDRLRIKLTKPKSWLALEEARFLTWRKTWEEAERGLLEAWL